MALAPSSFKLREGEEFTFECVSPGLYTVSNAYDGVYEYFKDKPIDSQSLIPDPSKP